MGMLFKDIIRVPSVCLLPYPHTPRAGTGDYRRIQDNSDIPLALFVPTV
jgi:hypothetical protein